MVCYVVISSEHPMLHHLDRCGRTHVTLSGAAQTAAERIGRGRDGLAEWRLACGSLDPSPLGHEEGRNRGLGSRPRRRGRRSAGRDLQNRWNSLRVTEFLPGPGKSGSRAVSMSSINFADVLIAFGRFPPLSMTASRSWVWISSVW